MTIPVFYSISDDFAKYAAVSLNSLVKNANPQKDYTVTFLNQDLSEKHQNTFWNHNFFLRCSPNSFVVYSDTLYYKQ